MVEEGLGGVGVHAAACPGPAAPPALRLLASPLNSPPSIPSLPSLRHPFPPSFTPPPTCMMRRSLGPRGGGAAFGWRGRSGTASGAWEEEDLERGFQARSSSPTRARGGGRSVGWVEGEGTVEAVDAVRLLLEHGGLALHVRHHPRGLGDTEERL